MRAATNQRRVCRQMCIFFLAFLAMTIGVGCSKQLAGRPERIHLVDNRKPSQLEQSLVALENKYAGAGLNPQNRRDIRDEYAAKMIAAIDEHFEDFLDDLTTQRKGFDASSDIMAISLDTASVLFTPTSTKSILAGFSGLTTASKTAVNKVYFYEQTLPAVMSQMEANRQAILADIMEGLTTSVDAYSLQRAQRDLRRYYTAGTIDGAVTEIQKQAAKKAEDAQSRIRGEVESDISAARERRTKAYDYMTDEARFDGMRSTIKKWWEDLSEEDQFEQIDLIVNCASKDGVSVDGLKKEGKVNPSLMRSWLDTLAYSPASRLLLADIVRNARGIAIPK